MKFQVYLGIDQTGAGKLTAKPLKAVALFRESKRIVGHQLLQLDSLKPEVIRTKLQLRDLRRMAILIDSVLGLPEATWPGQANRFWTLCRWAQQEPLFGRDAAHTFFSRFWRGHETQAPHRLCERLASANSIFRFRPFQKNIQTGSFRIWKDLGSTKKWANIYPFDLKKSHPHHPWLFECYPSFLWKMLFDAPKRDFRFLEKNDFQQIALPSQDRQLLQKDADLQDAFVNAYAGFYFDQKNQLFNAPPRPLSHQINKEGWILGLDFPKDKRHPRL